MRTLLSSLFLGAALFAAGKQTFTGIITDNLCAHEGGHSQMGMGPTDAECARACIEAHGAAYVVYDGKNVYTLSDQQTPEQFAGQRVRVTGTLDTKTKVIRVDTIAVAK
jgi:hypothetical protein